MDRRAGAGYLAGWWPWADRGAGRERTMTEAEWLACMDPEKMLEFLQGKASQRKLRLFAVACCRRVWHLLVDKRSRYAVEVAERFADGATTDEELEAGRQDAWEFSDHIVHREEAYATLEADALNAADAPAWASEWSAQPLRVVIAAQRSLGATEGKAQADLIRCIIGNPFRPVTLFTAWLTWHDGLLVSMAQKMYDSRDSAGMPVLADALEEAGCQDSDILGHCRSGGDHFRGCWVIDLLLGRS
jgi:hypothetical protein